MTRTARRAFAGFSLIGILVVMAIVLVLYFGAGSQNGIVQSAQQTQQKAIQTRKQMDLNQIATVVAAHELQTGEYPTSPEDMDMQHNPVFQDSFGKTVRLRVEKADPRATATLVITGAGEDGVFDTPDDETWTQPMPY